MSEMRPTKFPPKPVKQPRTAKEVARDTIARYPRVMAALAK